MTHLALSTTGMFHLACGARATFCNSRGGVTLRSVGPAHARILSHMLDGGLPPHFCKKCFGSSAHFARAVARAEHVCAELNAHANMGSAA